MALNNNDEDYLDKLLNSVAEGKDIDEWFEQELENGNDDISFDDELIDANDDIEIQEIQNSKIKDIFIEETDEEKEDQIEEQVEEQIEERVEEEIEKETVEDVEKDLKNRLNEEVIEGPELDNNMDLSESLDTSDTDDDINDIINMIENMENEANKDEEQLVDDREIKKYEDIHPEEEEEKIQSDNKQSKKFLGNLFSKKKEAKEENSDIEVSKDIEVVEFDDTEIETKKRKRFGARKRKKDKHSNESDDNSIIHIESILEETGSTMDDMNDLGLGDFGLGNEFGFNNSKHKDLNDELEDEIPTKAKKKKEKKEKKEKESKEPRIKKQKKPKVPVGREEKIRITPLGVILAVTIIVAIVCITYFGSNAFSYNKKIDEATVYYVEKNYTKAYELLVGMDIKKDDEAFYEQVISIMKVEKYYNEFHTYYKLEMYTEGLDTLIRGIRGYDNIIDEARELGSFDQTTGSLGKIVDCLSSYYGISEGEARQLSQMEDKSEYSKIIYDKAVHIIKPDEGANGE